MLPFRLVYSERYDLNWGARFPLAEIPVHARPVSAHALRDGGRFCSARAGHGRRHAARAHARVGRGSTPWNTELSGHSAPRDSLLEADGGGVLAGRRGTTLAARQSLSAGVGFNVGGGFHHAFAGHGEGFCAINDIAVAVRRLQHDKAIQRAMVVDCDVHHGNGTAGIFAGDLSVFTLSIHQFNNYPSEKPPSSLDIHLADGIGDGEYLQRLSNGYRAALTMFKPELVLYVAGADPYLEDQLGGLSLTFDGLKERDRPGDLDGIDASYPGCYRAGWRLCAERGRHGDHPRQYRRNGARRTAQSGMEVSRP